MRSIHKRTTWVGRKKLQYLAVGFFLLASCDFLPNDLLNPAHARYVASGDKAKDRRQFEAYIFICNDLLQPYFDDVNTKCRLENPTDSCDNSFANSMAIAYCAADLVDYHPGARPDEFTDSSSF